MQIFSICVAFPAHMRSHFAWGLADLPKLSAAKAEEVKKILKNYDGMSAKTRQALKNLGFEITEDGKHYKVTYYGDGRYQTVYSKTPSDGRTGKNSAQQTINLVF